MFSQIISKGGVKNLKHLKLCHIQNFKFGSVLIKKKKNKTKPHPASGMIRIKKNCCSVVWF